MMAKNSIANQGFSLIEIVIAMIIFTILAAGISATSTQAKKVLLGGKDKLAAVNLLEKEMSQLRLNGARNLTVGTTTRATTRDQDGMAGTLTTQVIAAPAQPQDKFVRLRLEWAGSARAESLAAFLFQE